MNSDRILRFFVGFYLVAFFAYLFLPLGFMVVAAFNASRIPMVTPWRGFTYDWFGELMRDHILWHSVRNSGIIGLGVIALSIPLGLAGALLVMRLRARTRTFVYSVLLSPVLTPGVILGISTLVFWVQWNVTGGLLLTVIAQSTFIASYCMLIFMARLQRFDPMLEEAALDLGASHQQVFWKITLPFLQPAILSAAVIAFLQSFENYNTTMFTIGGDTTLTVRVASMVRLGLTPEVNALAVLFIVITVAFAILYEVKRRAEKAREEVRKELARRADQKITAEGVAVAPA